MKVISKIIAVGLTSVALTACADDVVSADEVKKMEAAELATLYCTATKETNIEQLKVLISDSDAWQMMKDSKYANDKEIARAKLKAEKFDCTITNTKKREKYTKFYFKNFKTTYVYHENGVNVLKI